MNGFKDQPPTSSTSRQNHHFPLQSKVKQIKGNKFPDADPQLEYSVQQGYKKIKEIASSDEEEKWTGFEMDEGKGLAMHCIEKRRSLMEVELSLRAELIAEGGGKEFLKKKRVLGTKKDVPYIRQKKVVDIKRNSYSSQRRTKRKRKVMNESENESLKKEESEDEEEKVIPHSFCIKSLPQLTSIKDLPLPSPGNLRSGKYVIWDDQSANCGYEEDPEVLPSDDEMLGRSLVDVEYSNSTVSEVEFKSPNKYSLRRSPRTRLSDQVTYQLARLILARDEEDEYGIPVVIDGRRGVLPPKPLCFSCGSAGINQLIYCWDCAEPFHPYCIGDESLLSCYVSTILPKTNKTFRCQTSTETPTEFTEISFASLLSPPLTPMPLEFDEFEKFKEAEILNVWIHWKCRRCSVCCICANNMETDSSFLRCVSCPKYIHQSCWSTNGKKLTTDKWTCDECFKCNSCKKLIERRGAEARAREVGGQILCIECYRQKRKGSFCPICDVCYSDDDYDTRMMECGKCSKWIHAKCEQINEEHYQVLSSLPESIEYICRLCEEPLTAFWRQAVSEEISKGCESALRIFEKKLISTPRKTKIFASCEKPKLEYEPFPILSQNLEANSRNDDESSSNPILIPVDNGNKKIIRELFPVEEKKNEEIQDSTEIQKRKRYKSMLDNRECRVVLNDFTKRSSVIKKAPSLSSPPTSSITAVEAVVNLSSKELKCEIPTTITEISTLSPPTPAEEECKFSNSPRKSFKLIFETLLKKNNNRFTSVLSTYKETLRTIETGSYEETFQKTKENFISSIKEIFPWFNPEEIERINSNSNTAFLPVTSRPNINNSEAINFKPFLDVFWDSANPIDKRICSFCHEAGDGPPESSGRLLWAGVSDWVHANCALWSSEVWEEENGALQQVGNALSRSKSLSCEICNKKGASVSCCVPTCSKSFHFPCALNSSCILLENKGTFCPEHVKRAKGIKQQDMQVLRRVFVDPEFLRRKEKQAYYIEDLVLFIGSLQIDSLGHILPLSHSKDEDVIVPVNYKCSRIFWSFDPSSPYQKQRYDVQAVVKRKPENYELLRDLDINITVDHNDSSDRVQQKLCLVDWFHDWVDWTPTFIDENGETWVQPCGLNFGSDSIITDAEYVKNSNLSATTSTEIEYENILDNSIKELLPMDAVNDLDHLFINYSSEDLINLCHGDNNPSPSEEATLFDEEVLMDQMNQYIMDLEHQPLNGERNPWIPQIDGADTDSSDEHSSSSSCSSSNSSSSFSSSSSDEEEEPVAVSSLKSRRRSKLQKSPNEIPNSKRTTRGSGNKGSIVVGGRILRSRPSSTTSSPGKKVEKMKCSNCSKVFFSSTSLNRHTTKCKVIKKTDKQKSNPRQYTSNNLLNIENIQSTSSKLTLKSKKVRKQKNKEEIQETEGIFIPEERIEMQADSVTSDHTNMVISVLPSNDIPVVADEKTYCQTCRNTYKTFISFQNHKKNCYAYSSDDSEDDTTDQPSDSQPNLLQVDVLNEHGCTIPEASEDIQDVMEYVVADAEVDGTTEGIFYEQNVNNASATVMMEENEEATMPKDEIETVPTLNPSMQIQSHNNYDEQLQGIQGNESESNVVVEEIMTSLEENTEEATTDEDEEVETGTQVVDVTQSQMISNPVVEMERHPRIQSQQQLQFPLAFQNNVPTWNNGGMQNQNNTNNEIGIPQQYVNHSTPLPSQFSFSQFQNLQNGCGQTQMFPNIQQFSSVNNTQNPNMQQFSSVNNVQTQDIRQFSSVQNVQTPNMQQFSAINNVQTPNLQHFSPLNNIQTPNMQQFSSVNNVQMPNMQQFSPVNNVQTPNMHNPYLQRHVQQLGQEMMVQPPNGQGQYFAGNQNPASPLPQQYHQNQNLYNSCMNTNTNPIWVHPNYSIHSHELYKQQQQPQWYASQCMQAQQFDNLKQQQQQQMLQQRNSQVLFQPHQAQFAGEQTGAVTSMFSMSGNSQAVQQQPPQRFHMNLQALQHLMQQQSPQRSVVPPPPPPAQKIHYQPLSPGISHIQTVDQTPTTQLQFSNSNIQQVTQAIPPHPLPPSQQLIQMPAPSPPVVEKRCILTRVHSLNMPCTCETCCQKRGIPDQTRKFRPRKSRNTLAAIVPQGEGLVKVKHLPTLLPATATVTRPIFKKPTTSHISIPSPSTVISILPSSINGPGPTASTSNVTTFKPPPPSPNIAVVRPMEHPLQKLTIQVERIGSPSPSVSSISAQSQNIFLQLPPPPPTISATLEEVPAPMEFITTENDNSQVKLLNDEDAPVSSPESEPELVDISGEDEKTSTSPVLSTPKISESESVTSSSVSQDTKTGEQGEPDSNVIKMLLKQSGDSYSINNLGSGPTKTTSKPGQAYKHLKIKGTIRSGEQAGTSTEVLVQPVVHTVPIPDPNGEESNLTIVENEKFNNEFDNENSMILEPSLPEVPPRTYLSSSELANKKALNKMNKLTHRAVIVYEVTIDGALQYKTCDVRAVWGYVLERVQGTRRNRNLPPLSYPPTIICNEFNKLGLKHQAVEFLIQQLPGINSAAKEDHVFKFHEPPKSTYDTPVVENPTGCARSEGYKGRKPFDLFGWLASKHRQPEGIRPVSATTSRASEAIKSGNLPVAMQYRNLLKQGTKHLNVFWSSIHGRGLFTTRNIEAGEIIIEYAGELIRSNVSDLREKYYESKGIGCYMFRYDDNYVVDATLKGNAARFINHSCDPNCKSKMVEILGTKHILILALRKIPSGEELTYDYKFEEEAEVFKIPCRCGTHKCRRNLN